MGWQKFDNAMEMVQEKNEDVYWHERQCKKEVMQDSVIFRLSDSLSSGQRYSDRGKGLLVTARKKLIHTAQHYQIRQPSN